MKCKPWIVLFLFFGASLLLSNCIDEKKEQSNSKKFSIVDSISIPIISQSLVFGGYLPEEDVFLFGNTSSEIQIIETDRNGEILQSFYCGGEGEEKIGYKLSGLGYLNEKDIGIISERGLYQFKRSGEFKSFVADPDEMTRFNETKLYAVNRGKSTLVVGSHHSFSDSEQSADIYSNEFYEKFNHFTLYELPSGEISSKAGFDDHSFFQRRNEVFIGNIHYLHDEHKGKIYLINNPDPAIYVYNVKNDFSYEGKISLRPDFFKLQKSNTEFLKALYSSSSYTGIVVEDQKIIITYRTGVPEEAFPSTILSAQEGGDLYNKHNKVYVMLYENGQKVTCDILCSDKIYRILASIGQDEYLVEPNTGKVELPDKEIFYICKLEKK